MSTEPEPSTDDGDGTLLTDTPPAPADKKRWRQRLITFAMACGLVIGAAALTLEVETQRDRDQRSLIAAEQKRLERIEEVLTAPDAVTNSTTSEDGARVTTVFSADEYAAVVTYTDLPDIPDARTYQLWRIRNDIPKSMRVLAPDARSGTAYVLDLGSGDAIGFTVEPENGLGQPTGEMMLALPLTPERKS